MKTTAFAIKTLFGLLIAAALGACATGPAYDQADSTGAVAEPMRHGDSGGDQ